MTGGNIDPGMVGMIEPGIGRLLLMEKTQPKPSDIYPFTGDAVVIEFRARRDRGV